MNFLSVGFAPINVRSHELMTSPAVLSPKRRISPMGYSDSQNRYTKFISQFWIEIRVPPKRDALELYRVYNEADVTSGTHSILCRKSSYHSQFASPNGIPSDWTAHQCFSGTNWNVSPIWNGHRRPIDPSSGCSDFIRRSEVTVAVLWNRGGRWERISATCRRRRRGGICGTCGTAEGGGSSQPPEAPCPADRHRAAPGFVPGVPPSGERRGRRRSAHETLPSPRSAPTNGEAVEQTAACARREWRRSGDRERNGGDKGEGGRGKERERGENRWYSKYGSIAKPSLIKVFKETVYTV